MFGGCGTTAASGEGLAPWLRVPRLPPPVESAAYFAVAETLANVAKHAGARSVHIRAAVAP